MNRNINTYEFGFPSISPDTPPVMPRRSDVSVKGLQALIRQEERVVSEFGLGVAREVAGTQGTERLGILINAVGARASRQIDTEIQRLR